MRGRINTLAQSIRNPVDQQKRTESLALKEQPEALASSGTRAPGLRLPAPIEAARLSDLKRRRNARTHSKKQIRQIANSFLRFGYTSRERPAASMLCNLPRESKL